MEGVEQQQDSRYNTLSIVGFILAFLIPPVGFILGIVALSHINKTGEKGKGLAIAAIVLGAIFFFMLIFMVLVGISWVLVKNTVQNGDNANLEGIGVVNVDAMCAGTDVVATKVIDLGNNAFDVTLTRNRGEDQIGGVKLVFTNNDKTESYVADASGNIGALMSKTASVTIPTESLSNPGKVSVVVYFMDNEGNAQLCTTANQLSF